MRIGILGGTFDPIHFGHINLAKECKKRLRLHRIILVPAKISPHKKKAYAASIDRLIMARLAIKGYKGFAVSDIEVRRRGSSYTVKTLKYLRKIYKNDKLYFITGADSVKELKNWKDIKNILQLCNFIVAARPGFTIKKIPQGVTILKINELDISSQDIRVLIRAGRPVAKFLPQLVWEYIAKNKLYE